MRPQIHGNAPSWRLLSPRLDHSTVLAPGTFLPSGHRSACSIEMQRGCRGRAEYYETHSKHMIRLIYPSGRMSSDFLTSNSCAVSTLCSDKESTPARDELKFWKAFDRRGRILPCHSPENAAGVQEEGGEFKSEPTCMRMLSSFVSASQICRSTIVPVGRGLGGRWERI